MRRLILFILTLVLLSSVVYADLLTDVELSYTLDDVNLSGSDPLDSTINGNDGTNQGATTGVAGVINEAFSMTSGTVQRINVPDLGIASTTWTICSFMKASFSSGDNRFFFDQDNGDRNVLAVNAGTFQYFDGSFHDSGVTVNNGQWHHTCVVKVGSGFTLYVNGTNETSGTGTALDLDATDTYIGTRGGVTTNTWSGQVDEINIWSRELTPSEIAEVYNSGAGLQYPYAAPAVGNFDIVVTDVWDSTPISNVSASIDLLNGTNVFTNTTGNIIYTTILSNISQLSNITITNPSYFSSVYIDVNMSTTLNANLTQAIVRFNATSLVTDQLITPSNFTINGITKVTDDDFNIKAGLYNVTFSSGVYKNKTVEINITALSNQTINIPDNTNTTVTITAIDENTAIPLNIFTITTINNTYSFSDITATTSGTVILDLVQGIQYNFTISGGVFPETEFLTPNTDNESIQFNVTSIGALPIRVRDSNTGELITGNVVTASIDNGTDQLVANTTTGLVLFTGLDVNESYDINLESSTYEDAFFTFSYDASFATTGIDLYMNSNGTETFFVIQRTDSRPVDAAEVIVETFINGTLTLIGSKNTDVIGSARFLLIPFQKHQVTVVKDGFITQTFEVQVDQESYLVTLQVESLFEFSDALSGIQYSYSPTNSSIVPGNVTFFWNVTALSNDLASWSIEVYNGSSLITSVVNSSSSNGGVLLLTVDLSAFNNSQVETKYIFQKSGQDSYTRSVLYNVELIVTSFTGSLQEMRTWASDNIILRDKLIIWSFILFVFSIILVLIGLSGLRNIIPVILLSFVLVWGLGFDTVSTLIVSLINFIILFSGISLTRESDVI
jgi:hypothetical protein